MKKSLISIVIILFSIVSYGQFAEQIRSGRPGQSIGPFTLGSKVFQMQSGYSYMQNEISSEDYKLNNINNVIRLGILERLEFSAAINYSHLTSKLINQESKNVGIDNFSIGGRYAVLSGEGVLPAVGFQSRLILPINSQDFENPDYGVHNILVLQKAIGEKFSLTTNWIYTYRSSYNTLDYTLNSAYSIDKKWSVFFEFFGNINNEFSHNYNFGVAYLSQDNIQWDISFGRLTELIEPIVFVDVGLSWRIDWR